MSLNYKKIEFVCDRSDNGIVELDEYDIIGLAKLASKLDVVAGVNEYVGKCMALKYYFDVYKFTSFISTPITLVVGLKDDLITRCDINEFISLTNCEAIYVNDGHLLENDDSWVDVIELIRGML